MYGALLTAAMVTPGSAQISVYIGTPPPPIRMAVLGSNPRSAIEVAGTQALQLGRCLWLLQLDERGDGVEPHPQPVVLQQLHQPVVGI